MKKKFKKPISLKEYKRLKEQKRRRLRKLSFIGRTSRRVFSKDIPFKSLEKSIVPYFCEASLLRAVAIGIKAVQEMVDKRKNNN